MTGDSGDYEDEGDDSDHANSIPTSSWPRQAATELERFHLETSDVDSYEGKEGNNADEKEEASQADDESPQIVEDRGHSRCSNVNRYQGKDGDNADEEEEESQSNDWSTQTVEDWGLRTRECADWTVYFRPVKYNNDEANARARNVSKAKTVF